MTYNAQIGSVILIALFLFIAVVILTDGRLWKRGGGR